MLEKNRGACVCVSVSGCQPHFLSLAGSELWGSLWARFGLWVSSQARPGPNSGSGSSNDISSGVGSVREPEGLNLAIVGSSATDMHSQQGSMLQNSVVGSATKFLAPPGTLWKRKFDTPGVYHSKLYITSCYFNKASCVSPSDLFLRTQSQKQTTDLKL